MVFNNALIIQFGYDKNHSQAQVTLPICMTNSNYKVCMQKVGNTYEQTPVLTAKSVSNFNYQNRGYERHMATYNSCWIIIGY